MGATQSSCCHYHVHMQSSCDTELPKYSILCMYVYATYVQSHMYTLQAYRTVYACMYIYITTIYYTSTSVIHARMCVLAASEELIYLILHAMIMHF